ncbi:MAG: hypothetical protein HOI95_28130 [Chromatiales bacterium]|jgi:hypothetical protein|nr:hypothetical protein [Chromatiales bacterium]
MSNYILVVQIDVPDEHEAEFNRLYDGEHVPNLKSVKGVSGAQRYKLEGEATDMLRYLAIYQIDSPEVTESAEWQEKATTPGWMEVRAHVKTVRRGLYGSI